MQTLLLSAALVVFGVIATVEISKSIHQKIRLRRDKAASAPHRGEESTWNELTEHHRPVRHSKPEEFTAGPHERLLAICAPYSLCRRDPWDHLTCSDLEGTRTMLSLDWGVCSRADLLSQVHWLITCGHRTGFDAERARWVDTSLAEAERHDLRESAESSSDAAETLWRLERMLNNDRDIRNVDFSAWDLVRAGMLTRCGFALGWLTEDETWDTLAILDRGLRERYRGWTQVSESFRLARWYWSSTSGKDEHFNDLHDLNRSLAHRLGRRDSRALVPDPRRPARRRRGDAAGGWRAEARHTVGALGRRSGHCPRTAPPPALRDPCRPVPPVHQARLRNLANGVRDRAGRKLVVDPAGLEPTTHAV